LWVMSIWWFMAHVASQAGWLSIILISDLWIFSCQLLLGLHFGDWHFVSTRWICLTSRQSPKVVGTHSCVAK
jgi:hypothetical protein